MPASSRSCSSFIVFLIGTCALLVLILVLLTGGFVVDAGPLHLSARRWTAPLVITLVAFGIAALHGRASLRSAASLLIEQIDRHAFSAALVIAFAAAATGVGFGTYSASGADAAGYVSQAHLLGTGRLVFEEPLARVIAWPDATWTFSPLGYRPGLVTGQIVPTYPSGLPLTMAAARLLDGDLGVFVVVPLLGALAVFCTYTLGTLLHSRTAGLVAAALLASSPIFLFHIVQPMSDVPATAWVALAVLFALLPLRLSAFAAGATTGFVVLTRPNLIPVAAVIAVIAVRSWFERSATAHGRLFAFVAGLVPAIGTLALLQWRLYGQPFTSGYGSFGDLFALSNIPFNAMAYGARLIKGEAAALALAVLSLGVLAASGRSRGDASDRHLRPSLMAAALVASAVIVCYLPYGSFAEWSYLRFLLPASPLAFVVVGAMLTNALGRLPLPVRGIALLVPLVAAVGVNVNEARREQAFNLRRYEARYRDAGRYLESALPPGAVVLAVQESAAIHHYAHVPIVRWDLLRTDLDTAVAALRARRRVPLFLVEDWETADIQKRFPTSVLARLDWRWRAEFGDETRVRLFDPADRERPADRIPTDRVH
jgi:hypothetical protein